MLGFRRTIEQSRERPRPKSANGHNQQCKALWEHRTGSLPILMGRESLPRMFTDALQSHRWRIPGRKKRVWHTK
jgi:hypothetical protein